ncbi:MAG TPA: hypothetical protein VHI52_03345, partial [Verrucomicrobiae bacterium]|nr:hypothetical protein [Verrucomicrobiae bacterium]
MKSYSFFAVTASSLLLLFSQTSTAAEKLPPLVYESPEEFFGSGDFDGDGRADMVIVDRVSGKYRLGYQTEPGTLAWVDCRPSGVASVTGFSIGALFATNLDALAFTSPDANQMAFIEAASITAPGKPLTVPFTVALGPSALVAADVGGDGNTGLLDIYVTSIYNSPDANLATLLRNDGAQFPKISEAALPAPARRGNRLALKAGGREMVCVLLGEDKGDTLRVDDVSSGKPVTAATLSDLPAGSDYTVGNFRGSPLREFLFYKPGEKTLMVRPVEEASAGQFQFGKGDSFDLGQPIRRVIALEQSTSPKLFVIFGEGQKAGIYDFDGTKAPVSLQTISATNDLFTCAASLPEGFVVLLQIPGAKFSSKYQIY